MAGPSANPTSADAVDVTTSWSPRQLLVARLSRVTSYFGDSGPSFPREVWDFLPTIAPNCCKEIANMRPHVFRMKPIPSFGTEEGIFLCRKRKTEWGNRYFEVKFLSVPRCKESTLRDISEFVRALGGVLNNGTPTQTNQPGAAGTTASAPTAVVGGEEDGDGEEEYESDEDTDMTDYDESDGIHGWSDSDFDSEYSWGRSTESRERRAEWVDRICCCEGSYKLGFVVGRDDLYFTVEEDPNHLHYRKLSGGVFVNRDLKLPETIEEISFADGHLFVVGASRRLYMLKSDTSGWVGSITLPGKWCPYNSHRFHDAVVDHDKVTKVLYIHQGESLRDSMALCVWENGRETLRVEKVEVCAARFLPWTGQQVVAGIFERNRMDTNHIETFGVMDMVTGDFLTEANSKKDDFLLNYPGGEVKSLSINHGSWEAVMIGYDQKVGYETVDFPSRYVWKVGCGTAAQNESSP
ncbi:hypothetical protein FOZ62_025494 [Perkinsus olseni]|uniref:Uncharacterized protein n=1 Tax=Perkinsus olseni TaxID=32597 RepID=A0A7J6R0G7_PEROL|nr:hypothetical protein FOZ62_025494 [Perkinsus olseni]